MFKKSSNPEPICDFLESLQIRGWQPSALSKVKRLTKVDEKGVIDFEAYLDIKNSKGSLRVAVDLAFTPHSKVPNCWLVSQFMLPTLVQQGSPGRGVISGHSVLKHYGKRLATQGDLFAKVPPENVWVIRRPADVEALLNAYDHVASLWGAPTIVNLPK